jgi:hypothetical protein
VVAVVFHEHCAVLLHGVALPFLLGQFAESDLGNVTLDG